MANLVEPAHVPFLAAEPGRGERANDVVGDSRPDHARPKTEDVAIVVLDALLCCVRLVTERGSDPDHLARCDGDAGTRAADDDGTRRRSLADRVARLARGVRVVVVGAEVDRV